MSGQASGQAVAMASFHCPLAHASEVEVVVANNTLGVGHFHYSAAPRVCG